MDRERREELVYRTISGEIHLADYDLKIVAQSPQIKYRAARLFCQIVEEFRYEEWPTHTECLKILIEQGLCVKDVDDALKELEKSIEDHKVALYNSFFDKSKFDGETKILSLLKSKQIELLDTRHSLDHLTLQGYAEMIRQQYLVYATLYTMEDKKLWSTPAEVDTAVLDGVMSNIRKESLSYGAARELARTEPWRSYWNINKNPFADKIGHLTDDQKVLVMFSQMYDGVHDNPKCPPDDVINNDDALDGWMIVQRKEREKEKKEGLLEGQFGHIKDASEVFLPVSSREDMDKIESMNDTQATMVKRQRASMIKNKGKVKDAEFHDQAVAIQQQSNQQFMNSVKGK